MKQTECAPLEAHDFISGGAWMYHEKIVKENEQLKAISDNWFKQFDIADQEVRRIKALNAELLEALKYFTYAAESANTEAIDDGEYISIVVTAKGISDAKIAIAKAEGK